MLCDDGVVVWGESGGRQKEGKRREMKEEGSLDLITSDHTDLPRHIYSLTDWEEDFRARGPKRENGGEEGYFNDMLSLALWAEEN